MDEEVKNDMPNLSEGNAPKKKNPSNKKGKKKEENVQNMELPSTNENVEAASIETPAPAPEVNPNPPVMNNDNNMGGMPIQNMQMNNVSDGMVNNMANQPTMNNGQANPFATAPKPKMDMKKLLVPIIAGVVVIVGVFVLLGVKIATSTPKAIFKNSVNSIYKELSRGIDDFDDFKKKFDFTSKALTFEGDISLKSDVKALEEYGDISKLKLGFKVGVDLKDEELLVGASLKGDSETLSGDVFVTDKKGYISANFLDKVIKADDEDVDIDFKEIQDAINTMNEELDWNMKDYDLVLKKFKNAFIKALDNKAMKKGSAKFEVDGKTVKATKVSYVIDEDSMQDLVKKLCETLLEDDDFIDKLSDITTLEKGDIKDTLKELKNSASDIDFKGEVLINVYVKGILNTPVGFSVEYNDKDYYSIYTDGKVTEVTFDNHVKSEYGAMKVVATATQEKKSTNVVVKYNKETVMTAEIREFSEKLIDFDATYYQKDEKYNVSVYLSKKEDKKSISGDYKLKVEYNKESVEVSGSYKLTASDNLELPSTSGAINADEVDTTELYESLSKTIEKDKVFSSAFSDALDELQKSSLKLNYYNMSQLDNEKAAIKLLENKKATVLYVGTYGYGDEYYLWYNLYRNLYYANSFAYYLNTNDLGSDFTSAAVKYVCPDLTDNGSAVPRKCATFPAIYFIKDGTVKKVLTTGASYSDIEDALKLIGID